MEAVKELISSKSTVTEKGSGITLKYYLTQKNVQGVLDNIYGVAIEECIVSDSNNTDVKNCSEEQLTDHELVDNISYSKSNILNFIAKLADGLVTPITLVNIIDDLNIS